MNNYMNIKVGFCTLAAMVAVNAGLSQSVTFTKITNSPVTTDVGSYTRAAWGDFRNAGLLDLFVCNYGGTNDYYRNNGDGTFTKVTQQDPVLDNDAHTGTAAADFDNDGNLDLLVSAGVGASSGARNKLYHNNGNGTFSRVSGGTLTNGVGYYNACAWADYDHDGFVDAFITNDGNSSSTGGKNLLFHNKGDGTFTATFLGFGSGAGTLWADYDNDGFDDLLVVNYYSANAVNNLYHNNGNGTFTPATNSVTTDLWPAGAQGAAWGDYDNDGLLDLFVSDNGGTRNHLYHNNGYGSFTNVTSGPMLSPTPGGFSTGCAWGDYDNDGYLDLFVANTGGQNQLFHNNGDGTFTEITSGDPVIDGNTNRFCNSVSWADYDNDGFLDLFVTSGTQPTGLGTNLFYHNNGNANAWLEVKLVGTVSNRSAIGAKVRIHATIGGKTFWQLREINTGGGWNIVPLTAHFGLGDATNVDRLRIEWPSGLVQEIPNVAARQILTITEPPRLLASTTGGVPQFSLKGGRGFQYEIDSSPDLAAWSPIGTLTITNLNGTALVVDTNPPASDQRFYRAISQ
jgi:hypothetical protein